ncbi:mitochondrial import inner membrane translocase subunit tim-10 [Thozetella sp. PMI_491]|nr:mitochondrial import inner membrane translocase subunit tim-10 [Thozetella sp. PMI_491]
MFGLGARKPTSAEKIAAVETEMRMMAYLHNQMTSICTKKCIPRDYREGELNKGESVCLDRCSAKFFEAQQKISDQVQKEMQARGGAGLI